MDSPPTPDNPRDQPYIQSPTGPAPTHETPGVRQTGSSLSDAAKKRVNKATETLVGPRCVITHTPYSVDYAHILPRATRHDDLERLEYSWGMVWGSLNVDTRYNVIRLNASLHRLFDQTQWILLPEKSILDGLFERTSLARPDEGFRAFIKDHAQHDKQDTYVYKLIPGCKLKALQLWQYKRNITTEELVNANDFDGPYFFPFEGLPTIRSHFQPHFVICNIGIKAASEQFEEHFPESHLDEATRTLIATAATIYESWLRKIPDFSKFRKQDVAPCNDPDTNTRKTRSARASDNGYRDAYNKYQSGSIPTKSSRKRQRQDDESDHQMLTEGTLYEVGDDEDSEETRPRMNPGSGGPSKMSDMS